MEISSIQDAQARTRTRIVQSPERIKRTITLMASTAIDDKKQVALQEAKARDLQAKMNALLAIEKVTHRFSMLVAANKANPSGRPWLHRATSNYRKGNGRFTVI